MFNVQRRQHRLQWQFSSRYSIWCSKWMWILNFNWHFKWSLTNGHSTAKHPVNCYWVWGQSHIDDCIITMLECKRKMCQDLLLWGQFYLIWSLSTYTFHRFNRPRESCAKRTTLDLLTVKPITCDLNSAKKVSQDVAPDLHALNSMYFPYY